MGCGDLLDGELAADGVADVAFAHAARHAVDGKRDLIHKNTS